MTYEKIVDYVAKAVAKKDFSKVEDMALQIDVRGEGEGALYVAVADKKAEVAPYEYKDNTAKLTIDADDLIAAIDGKAKNEFQLEGDVEKISALLNVLVAKKAPAKKAATPAKKAAPATKKCAPKAAPAKKAEAPKAAATKKAEAPKAAPAKKAEAPKAAATKKATAPKATSAKKTATPAKKSTK